jgi:Leucine-rich repeat (LRR) protein
LTSIDLTQNTALISVSVAANQITRLDLSQNLNLETLICSANQISYLDVQANIALTQFIAASNTLTLLNVKNGNNANFTQFFINNNPGLTCVEVDNALYSTTNWLNIDAGVSFSELCLTYVPDDNFEAHLEANNLGNGIANDDYVSTTSVTNALSLDVSSKNISDLTGIEDFLSLSLLELYNNNLTSLDVSNNTMLTYLSCSFNDITYLDISNNTKLETLFCSNNNLSVLNMKNGANDLILSEDLLYFRIFFDSNDNPNLTCIQVDNVAYSNANWVYKDAHTSFSESCTTYVPDTNFEQALIDLGYDTVLDEQVETANIYLVTSLDVSNKGISDLTGIEGFVSLANLNCSANNLKILNLNNNTVLGSLNASNNELQFLTFQNGNNQLINTSVDFNTTGNPTLSCIQVDNAAYSTTTWTTIDPGASFSQSCLTYVPDDNFEAHLEANNLGNGIANDDYVPTASIINVLNLDVSSKNISDFTGIEDFINLSLLDLYGNNLTSLDVSNNTKLKSLHCNNNSITSLDVSNNSMLTSLHCSFNALTNLDVSNNTKLEKLLCSNNNLSVLNMKNGANHLILSEDLLYFEVFFDSNDNPNLTCIKVDNEAYSNANWVYKDAHTSFNEVSCQTIVIAPKIYLQGASLDLNTVEETLMRDDLRVASLLPTTSPYTDGITAANAVFTTTGSNAIVDWVWVELRDENDNTTVTSSQSALLQRDGDVVATDGVSALSFTADHTNYHVVIKHRNHLGIMTENVIALTDVVTSVDFTNAASQITYGTNAQTTFGMPAGIVAMWTGNANGDIVVQYSGTLPDTPSILSKVLNDAGNFLSFPTYIVNGYDILDLNMDGSTQYSGTNPDTPFLLQNVLAHPGNFLNFSTYQIQEQLPEN